MHAITIKNEKMAFKYFFIICLVIFCGDHIFSVKVIENQQLGINSNNRFYNIIQRGKDLLRLIPKLGIKIGGQILNYIPSPYDVFNFGKQILIGLPQEIIAYTLHIICKYKYYNNINTLLHTLLPSPDESSLIFILKTGQFHNL